MTENTLVADGYVVGRHTEHDHLMRIRFTGGGDAFNIVMPVVHGQGLAQEIDNASVQSRPQPIGPDEMKLGTVFRLLGQQVRSVADGGKRLVLVVEMPDGARTLPIDLSPTQLEELIGDLRGA